MGQNHSAKAIFTEAMELPRGERAGFLERACGDDGALRARVAELLEAIEGGERFLASATVAGEDPLAQAGAIEAPGMIIGRYKLLEQIGEGGFGAVFLAEQREPVVRRVALKVIKGGMDTKQVIGRFEAERQALAMMDHPNIARVLDAGATAAGRPYFVMELVRGQPITAFCDRYGLSINARLELFRTVCEAVQHAHQKGIIHRDLKPSNVLVAMSDVGGGKPVAKVIDFGIAKATSARLTERTLFTEHRQMIGTPEYMSPEQAEMTAVDIDTRSDIYSLGALLYELLTGTTPFDGRALRSAALAEIQRIIREVDPPRPSTRLGAAAAVELGGAPRAAHLTESPVDIARLRGTNARTLQRTLAGELDWIVMKAMEKDRQRRYETANAFNMDLHRYLSGEPVMAAPPSLGYRLSKFVHRHRGPVVAGTLVLAVIIIGLIGTTVGFARASDQRDHARLAERDQAAAAAAATHEAELAARREYAARMSAAYAAIGSSSGEQARAQLTAAPERLRGWEWRHLWFLANPAVEEFVVLPGQGPRDRGNWETSPNGRWSVYKPRTGPVCLLDLDGPLRPKVLEVTGDVFSVCPSDDGRTLLLVSDQPLRAIDSSTGLTLWENPAPHCLGILSSGEVLVQDVHDTRELLDLRTGATLGSASGLLPLWTFGTRALAADPFSGGMLADLLSREPPGALSPFERTLPRQTLTAAGPFERQFAMSVPAVEDGFDSTVFVWHPEHNGYRTTTAHGPCGMRFRRDGEVILIGGRENASIVSARSALPGPSPLLGLGSLIREAAPGSAFGIFANMRGHVYRAPIFGAPSPWTFTAPFLLPCFGAAVSDDARTLLTTDWGCVTLWNAVTGEPLWRSGGWSTFLRATAISGDGTLVAAAAELGRVAVHDARTGVRRGVSGPRSPECAMGLAFSGDRGWIIVAWSNGAVQKLSASDLSRVEASIPGDGACLERLLVSPDGVSILTVCAGRGPFHGQETRDPFPAGRADRVGVVLRAVSDLHETGRWTMPDDPPTCAAFSPDGHRLAVGTAGGGVLLVDPLRPAAPEVLARLVGEVGALCWSPDGLRLAAGAGELVTIIDPAGGQVLLAERAAGRVALRFTPDGASLLAYGGTTGTWLETRWPDEATLLERDRARIAMDWLRKERSWQMSAAQARSRIEQSPFRSAEQRQKALGIIAALREQPAQQNNHALGATLREGSTDADRLQALEVLDAAIGQTPDAPNFRLTRATLLTQLKRYDEALESIAAARVLYAAPGIRHAPLLDLYAAEVWRAQGREREAAEALGRARAAVSQEQDPDWRAALQRDLDEAISDRRP